MRRQRAQTVQEEPSRAGVSAGLTVACFRVTLQARETVPLPAYKGSMLRGALGRTFRALACVRRGTGPADGCGGCPFAASCAYSYVFDTPAPPGSPKRFSTAPRPFVLRLPHDERAFLEAGERLQFGLVLIGRGIEYLSYFVFCFERMARLGLGPRRGRFRLERVEAVRRGEREQVLAGPLETFRPAVLPLRLADLVAPPPPLPARLTFAWARWWGWARTAPSASAATP